MTPWGGVAAAYRRSFATLCAGAIPTLLDVTAPGHEHLDVGCGTGDLALAAALEGRRVVAVDLDPETVAMTREIVAAVEPRARILEAAAPTLPLPDGSCDAITANFVVNHVPDPRAVIRDFVRVAGRSGRVAMTIWPKQPGPHLEAYADAALAAGAVPVPSMQLAQHLDFPRSVEGLAGISEEAGLHVERAEELRWTWHVAADDLMAGIAGGVGGAGRIHRAQSSAVRSDIETRVRALWSDFTADDGTLAFPTTAVLVVAVRP